MGTSTLSAQADDQALLANLLRALRPREDSLPDGFAPSRVWAARWGKDATTTRALIANGVACGLWEMKILKVTNVAGRLSNVPHYRPLKTNQSQEVEPLPLAAPSVDIASPH
jgi:hypothetical protein